MMQRWSEDTIRFMEDASSFGNYHKELAEILLPYLPIDGHVCDAGCGLGHLALALTERCERVTAVDASENALRGLMNRDRPYNLRVLHGDVFAMEETYDAMVFCYFGKADEILRLAKSGRVDKILVVRRDCSVHQFSGGAVPRKEHSINMLSRTLNENQIPYISKNIALELGQPFRSMEDALKFFQLYNKSDVAITPENLNGKLISTGRKDFPYYYPNVREMELIVFETKDLLEKV